jgi:lipoyl(octanoyl) transferase
VNTIHYFDLGFAPYRETWELQKAIQQKLIGEKLAKRQTESVDEFKPPHSQNAKIRAFHDVLLFVEHPHVYTLGKSGKIAHLLKTEAELSEIDASYEKIDRGGDITYHGPGQIVGYPILDLEYYFTDIHKYLRLLEEVIIQTCSHFGVAAVRIEKLTGVWVGNSKICAFGIKCSRWVTMHGFALNVNSKLDYFNNIVPCGISDKSVCSLESLLGRKVDENEVKKVLLSKFSTLFNAKIIHSDQNELNDYRQMTI